MNKKQAQVVRDIKDFLASLDDDSLIIPYRLEDYLQRRSGEDVRDAWYDIQMDGYQIIDTDNATDSLRDTIADYDDAAMADIDREQIAHLDYISNMVEPYESRVYFDLTDYDSREDAVPLKKRDLVAKLCSYLNGDHDDLIS